MANTIVTRGNHRVKLRSVAPGEVELGVVAALQYCAALALFFAPPRLLAGNGTALLTLANHPAASDIVKAIWALVFFLAGVLCHRAVSRPAVKHRKWAWQVVIPLWSVWFAGLSYPLFVGLQTNLIILAAVAALVAQWLVTRILVPLDSHWYSREVPLEEQRMGERSSGVGVGELAGSGRHSVS